MVVLQGVQELAPWPEKVSRGQGSHVEEPGTWLNVPGLQGKHSDVYATPVRQEIREDKNKSWMSFLFVGGEKKKMGSYS